MLPLLKILSYFGTLTRSLSEEIFFKLGARMKRQRLKCIDDLTKIIQTLDSQNKTNPLPHILQQLYYARHEL